MYVPPSIIIKRKRDMTSRLPASTLNHARTVLALTMLLPAAMACATNGYFTHGTSVKADGIAGIGIALPQDALAAASNPAGTAWLAERTDVGLTWFSPRRSSRISGNAFGPDAHYSGSGTRNFFIPEIGYIRHVNDTYSWGLAIYGNGGMNTDYASNPYARFGATGRTGVNLEQLFVTPSLAARLNARYSFGAGVNLLYQRFEAKGIGIFGAFSQEPGSVSNRGTDTSSGVGLRLGWTGQLTSQLTAGLTWSSKIEAGEFDRYAGLFADGGGFDVPENFGVGLTFKATDAATLAAEVQRINYSDVNSVGNPLAALMQGVALGTADGPGFGWRDVTTYKVGASFALSQRLTVRGGYSHETQPVPRTETFFNILAPGVIQDHVTVGATWTLARGTEISGYFAHAFSHVVRWAGSIPAALGGGEADIELSENVFGIAFAWKP